MTVQITDLTADVTRSLFYFLQNEQYIRDGNTKTLRGHHTGLKVVAEYPDLQKMTLPTVALISEDETADVDVTYDKWAENNHSFVLEGFVGGNLDSRLNRRGRDRLKNDIKQLLTDTEYLSIYSGANFGSAAYDGEIKNVKTENLPRTGMNEKEAWRFRCFVDIGTLRNR